MAVSGELLCSFELLKPLDSSQLKNHIKKGRTKRQSMLNSPVGPRFFCNKNPTTDLSLSLLRCPLRASSCCSQTETKGAKGGVSFDFNGRSTI